jgi:transcriptional regulator with XRE-family HTH domain
MIENGQRLPRVDTLLKVSGALEVNVERLLGGIEWIAPGPQVGGSFLVRKPA